jgi:hypothetical protein
VTSRDEKVACLADAAGHLCPGAHFVVDRLADAGLTAGGPQPRGDVTFSGEIRTSRRTWSRPPNHGYGRPM